MGMARTPLLLALLTTAFSRDDGERAGDLSQLQPERIFDRYIERRFAHEKARPLPLEFDEPAVREALQTLAGKMFEGWRSRSALDSAEAGKALRANADAMVAFAQRMHFLQRSRDGAIEFIHLKLRDFCALNGLIAALEQGTAEDRRGAARALGETGFASAVPALGRALARRESPLRVRVARALRRVGHAVLPGLVRGWWDEADFNRKEIADALARIGGRASIEVLRGALADKVTRWCAARRLAALGDASAVPALLERIRNLMSVEGPPEHTAALLSRLGKAAVPTVVSALEDPSPLRRRASAAALGWIGDPTMVPLLVRSLRDPVPTMEISAEGLPTC